MKIQVIHFRAKKWFDKINGNSYFSAKIEIDGETVITLPFQYGYGDQYIQESIRALKDLNIITTEQGDSYYNFREFCKENKIQLIRTKQDKCLKREVKAFGE